MTLVYSKAFFWLVGCDCYVLRRAPFLMAAHSFGFYRKAYATRHAIDKKKPHACSMEPL